MNDTIGIIKIDLPVCYTIDNDNSYRFIDYLCVLP